MSRDAKHFIAIVGGSISGSVCAGLLAENGIRVAVIEQNKKPYGKIEDGLPRWHVEQRELEYSRIDARLKQPGVHFVPATKLGRDIDFDDLCDNWGFSAVILANGAWRDRELGIQGAENFVSKGLVYQNPFIYWYNHKNEKGYEGPHFDAPDETLVVGGGLASIDVVKVLQLENYERAMHAHGIHTDMHELEKKGIPNVCRAHGIRAEELGVKGCTLIYRRREQDMALAPAPENPTADQVAKAEQVRRKILHLAQEKFLFHVQDRRLPTGLIVENGRLVGLKVSETKVEGRKAEPILGTEYELRAPMVISSIGSVPEVIPGVIMKGDYYTFSQQDLPRYADSHRIFGVGNVVTGKGNIRHSIMHSQRVTGELIENYVGIGRGSRDFSALYAAAEARAVAQVAAIEDGMKTLPPLSAGQVAGIERRIRSLQERVGYTSDYESWLAGVNSSH